MAIRGRQLADARAAEEAAQAACAAAQAAAVEAQQASAAQREQEFRLQVGRLCSGMPTTTSLARRTRAATPRSLHLACIAAVSKL